MNTGNITKVNTYDVVNDVRQFEKRVEFHLTRHSDGSSGWAGLAAFEGKATHRLIKAFVSDPTNKEKYELMRRRAQNFCNSGPSTSGSSFEIIDVKAVRHFHGTIEFRVIWKEGKTSSWVEAGNLGGGMKNWYVVEFLKKAENKKLHKKAQEEQKEYLRRTTTGTPAVKEVKEEEEEEDEEAEDEEDEEEAEEADDEEEDEEEEEAEEKEDEEDEDADSDDSNRPMFIVEEVTDVRYDARNKKLQFYAVYQGYPPEDGQWQTARSFVKGLETSCIKKFARENSAVYNKAYNAYKKNGSDDEDDREYRPHQKRQSSASASKRLSRRRQLPPSSPPKQSPSTSSQAQSSLPPTQSLPNVPRTRSRNTSRQSTLPPNSQRSLSPPNSPRPQSPIPPTQSLPTSSQAQSSLPPTQSPPNSARPQSPIPPRQSTPPPNSQRSLSPPNSPRTQSPLSPRQSPLSPALSQPNSPRAQAQTPSKSTEALVSSSSSQTDPSSSQSSLPPSASNLALPQSRSQATQSAALPCSPPTDDNPLPHSLQDVLDEEEEEVVEGIVIPDTSSDEDEDKPGPSQPKRRKIRHGQEPGNNLIPSSSTSPQNDRFCPEVTPRETTGTQTDGIPQTSTGTQTEDCSPEPEPKLSNGELSENCRRRQCLEAIEMESWVDLDFLINDGVKLTGELPNGSTIISEVLESKQKISLRLMLQRGFDMRDVHDDLIFDEAKWMVDKFRTHLQNVVQEALDRGVSGRFNGFKPKAFLTFPLYRKGNDKAEFTTILRKAFEDMDWFEGIGFKVFTGFFDRETKEFKVSGKMPNQVRLYLDEKMMGRGRRDHSLLVLAQRSGRRTHKDPESDWQITEIVTDCSMLPRDFSL